MPKQSSLPRSLLRKRCCCTTRRSPRRGTRQAQLVEEFFDTSHSSEEVLYDAVTSVNVCVFSCPCMKHEDYQEITSYTISIPAL